LQSDKNINAKAIVWQRRERGNDAKHFGLREENQMIHNPRFGLLLKEKMDALGIECVFSTPKDYSSGVKRPFTPEMVDFQMKHLPAQ